MFGHRQPFALACRGHTVAVALCLVTGAGCRERVDVGSGDAGAGAAARPLMPEPPRQMYSAPGFVPLVEAARPSVVGIRATLPVKSGPAAMFPGAPDSAPGEALGTGFLIESRGVYVLTNDHIAAGAAELRVVLSDGTEVPTKVIGRDPALDLALLSIDVPRLKPLHMGDSDSLKVGEWIVVLGNPFGDGVTASAGLVSSLGHESGALMQGPTLTHRSYLQTDARIHRGNSGGPVLNTVGQVVGVAIATSDRPTEISFAIPINRVKEIVDALREHGTVARGWLGVMVRPLTPDLAADRGLTSIQGALVTEVRAGSPAARYGLRAGDVILRWDKTVVDHRSLPWVVAGTPVGRMTRVGVWRNRTEITLDVATDKMPQ
jgi:serine protease Do